MNSVLSSYIVLCCIFLLGLPCLIKSQTCQKFCGKQSLAYPFGSGPGCGDPRFEKYVSCSQGELTLTTHSGCYPITSIDYINQVIELSDPTMSTCSCARPSKGFGLDWDAPFAFHGDNIFALLDCSTTSSPIYKSKTELYSFGNSSLDHLCDEQGQSICNCLLTCRAISTLSVPISTCCIYTPVDIGPSFEMDLEKLQCNSYSAFQNYNGQEYNPEAWSYGVALKYKFNVNNEYPNFCADCERSNGVCGYTEAHNSFICNCPGGINTTMDCFFGTLWSSARRILPLNFLLSFSISCCYLCSKICFIIDVIRVYVTSKSTMLV